MDNVVRVPQEACVTEHGRCVSLYIRVSNCVMLWSSLWLFRS